MVNFSIATLHSIDRMKERCNIKSQRSAKRNLTAVLMRGKRAEDCTSWERSYLLNQADGEGSFAVAYNNFCYIINEWGCCITLYRLPTWFGKKKHFNGKERIRHFKKYCKSNRSFVEEYTYFADEAFTEGCLVESEQ